MTHAKFLHRIAVVTLASALGGVPASALTIRATAPDPADGPVRTVQNNFRILSEFHQPAAPNVEKADITIIRCQGNEYYIYRYYRNSGPNYRSIIPGRWGNPLGGRDHHTFDGAVAAACNW
jgi:hypothetical protein